LNPIYINKMEQKDVVLYYVASSTNREDVIMYEDPLEAGRCVSEECVRWVRSSVDGCKRLVVYTPVEEDRLLVTVCDDGNSPLWTVARHHKILKGFKEELPSKQSLQCIVVNSKEMSIVVIDGPRMQRVSDLVSQPISWMKIERVCQD
jgi:hypothetical protein